MLGIGPMLPVIPVAENIERSPKKQKKRKTKLNKLDPRGGSHELAVMRRPSMIKTESTLIDSNEDIESIKEYAVKEAAPAANHQRDLSLIVDFNPKLMSDQLLDGVISDLDLVLFVYWIKAKNGNYVMAKELVRELGLDQGYNIEKITNVQLRKMLQELHDIRPRFVLEDHPTPKSIATNSPRHLRQKSLERVSSPISTHGKVWFAAIGKFAKTKSDNVTTRDPQDISSWESPFQSKTPASAMRSTGSIRTTTSPLTARMDTLPPSLRLKRELAVQEAARANMTPRDSVGYPPNTPDRPAPLSVRSRASQASSGTPMSNTALRSVSTPIRASPQKGYEILARPRSNVPSCSAEALSLVSTSASNKGSRKSTNDVFDDAYKDGPSRNRFTDRLNGSEDRRHGTNERYENGVADGNISLDPYQLDASDIASESSYGTFSSIVRKGKDRTSSRLSYDGGVIGDDSFDALEFYIGTEDEDNGSLLESASIASEQEVQTQYQFAVQAPSPPPVITAPVPTPSQRHAAAESRRLSQVDSHGSPAVNFHRPLPLRSYESEATMFPTAGAQANSGRNRAKSVTSMIASRRPGMVPHHMPHQLSPAPGSGRTYNTSVRNKKQEHESEDSYTKMSEQTVRHMTSLSQRSSSASTLAAFPIPPMENPVGELPMLVSRATSSPQALSMTSSQHPVSAASIEDTYRAIVKVNLSAQLQRTRAKGERLQAVEWDKLTSFERAWREINDVLLVTIYGRADVVLDESDISYVDCVAKELRNASGGDPADNWIRRLFETDA